MPTVSFTTSGALRKSALRQANERLVLDTIRRNPGIARFELARVTGFSKTSVTFVVNRLLKDGLLREEKLDNAKLDNAKLAGRDNAKQAGRPPTALHLSSNARAAIGVEIARPESRVVLVDLHGQIQKERPVPWHPSPEHLLDKICRAIQSVAAGYRSEHILGVGIALPGTIDKSTGRVVAAETIGWLNVEVGATLRNRLNSPLNGMSPFRPISEAAPSAQGGKGSRGCWPLFFENNANVSALAEQWYSQDGAALRYFVYIRLRGGLGSGVVVDGRILHGTSGAGSEFGHVMLYPDGRPCPCGNRGCWEQYASDAALLSAYAEASGNTTLDDPREVLQHARNGNPLALQALRTTAYYLALGCSNVIAVLNPQAIIVGEPLASAWDLIEDTLQTELRARVPSYYLARLRILPARFDRDSALRGAAALALAHFFNRFDAMETHI
jgi:predicted NBD/HSP70 family sugar kinase